MYNNIQEILQHQIDKRKLSIKEVLQDMRKNMYEVEEEVLETFLKGEDVDVSSLAKIVKYTLLRKGE